jgi:serine phosphatase RsbU (regulator of sigma subunit)
VLALLLTLQLLQTLPLQQRLRDFLFDGYQSLAPRARLSSPVMIVDVDEASLQRFGQWPWPRSLLARLVGRILDLQPAALGIDVLMPEPDRESPCTLARYVPEVPPSLTGPLCALPDNDALLARELARGRVALAFAGVEDAHAGVIEAAPALLVGGDPRALLQHYEGALLSVEPLQQAAAGHGLINGDSEYGILRGLPLIATVGTTLVPSLALELLRLAAGTPVFNVERAGRRISGAGVGDLFIPTQADGSVWIHYGHFRSDRYLSAAAVLDGSIDPALIRQRLVLLGVSGLGLVDFPVNALGERVPGVDMHAQLLESIFDGTTLLRPRWAPWAEAAATAALALALVFGFASLNSMLAVGAALVGAAALLLCGFGFYAEGRILFDGATPSVLVVLLLGGMLSFELMREQIQRRALEASLRVQRESAARLAGEMAAARRIQLGMLPDVATRFGPEARLDVAARMQSARDVGGDLYDCFMLDEHRAFVLLGDVCGKGVPASLFMATCRTLCKSVALRGSIDLAQLMNQANLEIARENPEMLFVTAFAAILDLRDGQLCYANAGHERPFVVAPGRQPQRLDGAAGLPLGLVESGQYPVSRYRLAPDEFLCIFTDGVSEASDAAQAVFGIERLAQVLRAAAPAGRAQDVLDALFNAVAAFAAGAEPSDDVTVLVLRVGA